MKWLKVDTWGKAAALFIEQWVEPLSSVDRDVLKWTVWFPTMYKYRSEFAWHPAERLGAKTEARACGLIARWG